MDTLEWFRGHPATVPWKFHGHLGTVPWTPPNGTAGTLEWFRGHLRELVQVPVFLHNNMKFLGFFHVFSMVSLYFPYFLLRVPGKSTAGNSGPRVQESNTLHDRTKASSIARQYKYPLIQTHGCILSIYGTDYSTTLMNSLAEVSDFKI